MLEGFEIPFYCRKTRQKLQQFIDIKCSNAYIINFDEDTITRNLNPIEGHKFFTPTVQLWKNKK